MKPNGAALGLLLGLVFTVPALADAIALDAAGINRLGLVFAPVAAADTTSGTRFAARVIASPAAASTLHALHGGMLESWQVQPGQDVAAGAVLAVIRSPEVLTLQQAWMAAETLGQQMDVQLARDERLFNDGIIARQRLQETERLAREAGFHAQAMRSALEQAGFAATELEALRSEGRDLGRYRVRAPAAGTVAHLEYRAGQTVEQGAAVAMLSGDSLWVEAELPAALAARINAGHSLRLAETGDELVVRQKEQALDAATQTVGVLAEFIAMPTLLPGQIVTLLLPPGQEGIVVPADAVVHNGADTVIFVKTPDGVESRALALRPLGPDYLATGGLAAGEEVVVRGASLLKGITLGLGGE